ncbi:hypothetical protein M407DRAFT_244984 [Tulasnella calospora MUT 4182]|uniref:Uncharacterized protein n=1 Tax=Tulasnella calospora MUT 4182 TaxID=1051891 RepID=A0A0C3KNL0_9AGAM|nr:hypothetical protein M407DRAFT_244984 [Tulasnella calospora MUT 4182]
MEQDPDAGIDSTGLQVQPPPAVVLPSIQATGGAPSPANQPEQLLHIQYTSAFYNVHSLVRARYQDWEQQYDFWAFALDDAKRAGRRFACPGGYWVKPREGAEGILAGSKLEYYSRE